MFRSYKDLSRDWEEWGLKEAKGAAGEAPSTSWLQPALLARIASALERIADELHEHSPEGRKKRAIPKRSDRGLEIYMRVAAELRQRQMPTIQRILTAGREKFGQIPHRCALRLQDRVGESIGASATTTTPLWEMWRRSMSTQTEDMEAFERAIDWADVDRLLAQAEADPFSVLPETIAGPKTKMELAYQKWRRGECCENETEPEAGPGVRPNESPGGVAG